jgi:hypothetical protein
MRARSCVPRVPFGRCGSDLEKDDRLTPPRLCSGKSRQRAFRAQLEKLARQRHAASSAPLARRTTLGKFALACVGTRRGEMSVPHCPAAPGKLDDPAGVSDSHSHERETQRSCFGIK